MPALSPALLGALTYAVVVTQSDGLRCHLAPLADAADRDDTAAVKRELHGLLRSLCVDAAEWSESFCADVLGTDLEHEEPLDDAGASVAKLYADLLGLVAAELARVAAPAAPREPAKVLIFRKATP